MPPIIPTLIRPSTLLYKSLLLIVLLTLLTPLRRLILPALLLLIALFLRLMHSPAVVLRGTVYRHQLQWLRIGSINELVLRSRGHDHNIRGFDILFARKQSSTSVIVNYTLKY